MLDREMGSITDELVRLGAKSGLTGEALESACRMWFEQYGRGWYEKGLGVLKERARDIDPRISERISRELGA